MSRVAKKSAWTVLLSALMVVCMGIVACASDEPGSNGSDSSTAALESDNKAADDTSSADDGLEQSTHNDGNSNDLYLATLEGVRAPHILCVVEYLGNSISFLDAETGDILARLNVGVNPACLAATADGTAVYVANSGNGQIMRLGIGDSAEFSVMRAGTQPMALALDEDKGILYVADYHLNSIRSVDTTLMSLVDALKLEPKGYESRDQAPACCSNPLDGTVLDGRRPVSLALSPDRATLYCANIGTYDVSRVDLEARVEGDPIDGVIGFRDVIVSPDGKYLLIAGVGSDFIESNDLIVEDAFSGDVVARVPVGVDVSGVAWSGNRVVTTAQESGTFSCVDPDSWEVAWSLQLDPGIADVTFSKDGTAAFVGNSETGEVVAIDMDSQEIVWVAEGMADPRFLVAMS